MRWRPVLGLTLALCAASPAAALQAVLVGEFTWRFPEAPWFGSVSGFALEPDALHFRAVEDTGYVFVGTLQRDAFGRVTGAKVSRGTRLLDEAGEAVTDEARDAEGIALGPGSSFYVSYEREDRIVRYARPEAPAETLTKGLDLSWLTFNKGFEAISVDAQARLWTTVESAKSLDEGHPVLVFDGTSWSQPFSIPAKGTWRITDMDFGPDQKLYVLERDFWGLVGFRTRVLRLTIEGDRLVKTEKLLETQAGTHDNLECLSVWQDEGGAIRLTMVSDNNQNILQKTEIVDYRIVE